MSIKSQTILDRWIKIAQPRQWLTTAQFLLWPGTCVLCSEPSHLRRDLCAACATTLIEVANPCPGCGLPLPPLGHDMAALRDNTAALPAANDARSLATILRCGACHGARPLTHVVAPYAWEEPLSSLVSGYKYAGQLQHGRVLGSLLLPHVWRHYTAATLPQVLVPVPLHPDRLRQRGYNQALLLANQLGQALGIPVSHTLVQRQRNTTPQQGLSAAARRHNLDGAFVLADPTPTQNLLRIALVDDVITTMSTLNAMARLLHRELHHPVTLHGWAIARA